VYVCPKYVGRGVEKILQSLESVAQGSGMKLLHLWASLNAIPFYKKKEVSIRLQGTQHSSKQKIFYHLAW
jgi:GNAT superfamily N-acetyltransferase